MLRITITTHPEGVTVALEGRPAGPWVDAASGCMTRAILEEVREHKR